jgi:PAS domain S-box-containing protein
MISVLYVDDDSSLLEIGKVFLEKDRHFAVDTITSASAALTLLRTKNYDAIVSDYQMPGMDGIGFLKTVRSSGNTMPFILFTGRGREEIVIQALNEGADFYLQKGGEPTPQFAELAHKIRQAVQQRRAEITIRDHERREADIINFLPDATFAINTNGVVIAWNRAMELMSGTRAAQILGKGDHEYTLPFYHERRPALIDLVLREDPDLEASYSLLLRDGQTLIAEATNPFVYNGRGGTIWCIATPLYDTRGTIIGAIESVRDITRRKQAEMELSRKHEELNAAYNQLSAQEDELRQRMNDIAMSQSALREIEAKYHALIENARECIVVVQDEHLKFVNQRAMEISGYSKEEILSRPFLEFIHPDDRDMIAAKYRHRLSGNLLGVTTFRHVRKDGIVRVMELRAAPILWQGTAATLSLILDITEQQKAEETVRENHRILMGAMNLANLGIWESDPRTGILMFDSRFSTLYGTEWGRDSINNMTFKQYVRDLVHPEDRNLMIRQYEKARKTTEPHYRSKFEYRIILNNGEIRYTEICLRVAKDAEGRTVKIYGVNQDITKQKTTENSLVIGQMNLSRAMDLAHLADWELNVQTGVYTFNDRFYALYGTTAEREGGYEMPMDVYFREFVHPDDRDRIYGEIEKGRQIPDLHHVWQLKHRIIRRDGEIRYIVVRVERITDKNSHITKIHGVNLDITEHKKADDAFREAHRKLTLLARITRHDINNQLLALNGFVELLHAKIPDAALENYFARINEASTRISSMIDFAKTYITAKETDIRWQDIYALADTAAKEVTLRRVSVKNDLTAGAEVYADPMIIKVFYNLIENAVRYGGKISTIRFSGQEHDGTYVIVCEDDGDGIPAEDKERIFDWGVGKNTGLGLALSREILGITGIMIRETGEFGKGARFEMIVPKSAYRTETGHEPVCAKGIREKLPSPSEQSTGKTESRFVPGG